MWHVQGKSRLQMPFSIFAVILISCIFFIRILKTTMAAAHQQPVVCSYKNCGFKSLTGDNAWASMLWIYDKFTCWKKCNEKENWTYFSLSMQVRLISYIEAFDIFVLQIHWPIFLYRMFESWYYTSAGLCFRIRTLLN